MKLIHGLINFFKIILTMILGFFLRPFKNNKQVDNNNDTDSTENGSSKFINIIPTDQSSLPDTKNIKEDNHDGTTDNIILDLPKSKLEDIKKNALTSNEIIYTKELITALIEKEIEHVYKDQKLEIKKVNKELEEKIKKFEEKVIPKVEKQIEFYHLKKLDDVKKEVEVIVKDELKEFPILTPVVKTNEEQKDLSDNTLQVSPIDPVLDLPKPKVKSSYSLAFVKERELNLKDDYVPKVDSNAIASTNKDNDIKNTLSERKTSMVKNGIPANPSPVTDTLKNVAAVSATLGIKAIEEIVTPTKEPTPVEQQLQEPAPPPEILQTTQLDETDKELHELYEKLQDPTSIEEIQLAEKQIEDHKEKLEELKNEQNKLESPLLNEEEKEQVQKQKEEIEKKEEKIEYLVRDSEISVITIGVDDAISDSKHEIEKEDFFDKDYERIELQINKMLNDITNTRLRYGSKLSAKQKSKLERDENKLRDAKEHIESQKQQDIANEQKELSDYISYDEINGLDEELKRIDEENKKEVNQEFLTRMDNLEKMTREQVANVDKRLLFKKLNKASMLLEMGSILAFPFIRNRYFFYFTIGLIIDNHFNFLNAFWNRRMNKYEPADLSRIKQGQDALNGALDITYQNILELDVIEQNALARYPELANDPRFINQITNLRIKLNNNYNKLMHKNKIMETYYGKTKRHKKALKKELTPEN